MPQLSRFTKSALIPLLAALTTVAAQAAVVIDTSGGSGGGTTSGWGGTAQTFTAPAESLLRDWTFFLAPRAGGGSVGFSIYDWSGTAPVGPARFTSTLTWNPSGGATGVTGIDLALTPGNLYGAVIDLLGYTGESVEFAADVYAGGYGLWTNSAPSGPYSPYTDLDHRFVAVFDSGASVPAPGAIALLGLGFAAMAAAGRRGR